MLGDAVALWRFVKEFHIFFSCCSRCLLGIWTLFPRAPCSGSHLPLFVATVHGGFWTKFFSFPREMWTPSFPRRSHPGYLNIISTSSIWQSPRASVNVACRRISHIFIVTVDSDFPAQFALEIWTLCLLAVRWRWDGVSAVLTHFSRSSRSSGVERHFSEPSMAKSSLPSTAPAQFHPQSLST